MRTLVEVGEINALVLVMKAGRFTQSEKGIISRLRAVFGPDFWRHLCIFYTGATAKPQQLNLEQLAPELRRRLFQVEIDRCGDCDALQDIQALRLYGADLDPVLCCADNREKEFRLKRALKDFELEELLDLDRRIPPHVLELTDPEVGKFLSSPVAEAWIQGNYFQLGIHRLSLLKQAVESMDVFFVGGSDASRWREQPAVSLIHKPHEDTAPEVTGHDSPSPMAHIEDLAFKGGETLPALPPADRVPEDVYIVEQEKPETPVRSERPASFVAHEVGSPECRPNVNSIIRKALLEADTVVVRGPWVDKVCSNNGGMLPRREDLLSEAIWNADISYSKDGRNVYLV